MATPATRPRPPHPAGRAPPARICASGSAAVDPVRRMTSRFGAYGAECGGASGVGRAGVRRTDGGADVTGTGRADRRGRGRERGRGRRGGDGEEGTGVEA